MTNVKRKEGHKFRKKHFRTPRHCSVCDELIFGKGLMGCQCKICGIQVHTNCLGGAASLKCGPGTVHFGGIKTRLLSLSKTKKSKKQRSAAGEKRSQHRHVTLPSSLPSMRPAKEKAVQTEKKETEKPQRKKRELSKTDQGVCFGWQKGAVSITEDPDSLATSSESVGKGRKRTRALGKSIGTRDMELPVIMSKTGKSVKRLPSSVSFSLVMSRQQQTFIDKMSQVNALNRQASSLMKSMMSLEQAASSLDDMEDKGSPTPFVMANEDGTSELMVLAHSMDMSIAIPVNDKPQLPVIQKAIEDLRMLKLKTLSPKEMSLALSQIGLAGSRPLALDAAPSFVQLQELLGDSDGFPAMPNFDNPESSKEEDEKEEEEAEAESVDDDDVAGEVSDPGTSDSVPAAKAASPEKEPVPEKPQTLDEALAHAQELLAWTDQALGYQNPVHVGKFVTALKEKMSLIFDRFGSDDERVREVFQAAKSRVEKSSECTGVMDVCDDPWMAECSGEDEDSYSGSEFSFEEESRGLGFTL